MSRLKVFSVVIAVSLAAMVSSCASDSAVAPHVVAGPGQSERVLEMRAELLSNIGGMEFFLTPDGFDAMLQRGDDPQVVAERRTTLLRQLEETQTALRALESGQSTALFAIQPPTGGSAPPPPDCLTNGNLDNCFVGTPYSRTPGSGSGSVHQVVGTLHFKHSTATTLSLLDGGAYGPAITTNSPISVYVYAKTITYPALTCVNKPEHLTSTTEHQLQAEVSMPIIGASASVTGHKFSNDEARCSALSMTLSKTTLGKNDLAYLSIGGKPETCGALTVVSSNSSVVSLFNAQGDEWIVYSDRNGVATITARCADGSAGTASVTVEYPEEADKEVSPTGTTGGGGEDDFGIIPTCGWYVWRDVDTGQWLGDKFWLCEGDEPPPCYCPGYSSRLGGKAVLKPKTDPAGSTATQSMAAGAAGAGKARKTSASVVLVGTLLRGEARATVQVDKSGIADALVVVDLRRATAEDVEVALSGVSHLLNSDDTPPEGAELGVGRQNLQKGSAKTRAAKRSTALLESLKNSSEFGEILGKRGRILKFQADLADFRKYAKP